MHQISLAVCSATPQFFLVFDHRVSIALRTCGCHLTIHVLTSEG
ncbi:hypothetical protein GBAR_LOCUS15763 [Geodia barretti]|uniref:Uncharacterized protein n=1 Tax=Geodia barretti TaxID=519541 RepID=A0AA35SED0_GEOBA|nr:hypothetical protein GBAR_LOCUS15763 [Geodia barretti]